MFSRSREVDAQIGGSDVPSHGHVLGLMFFVSYDTKPSRQIGEADGWQEKKKDACRKGPDEPSGATERVGMERGPFETSDCPQRAIRSKNEAVLPRGGDGSRRRPEPHAFGACHAASGRQLSIRIINFVLSWSSV